MAAASLHKPEQAERPREHEPAAQKAFDALSATMDQRDTGIAVPSTIYEAVERRAFVRRANLKRRQGLMRFASTFRALAAVMGRQAGEIPANGDTLVKLEDAKKEECVERIKNKRFDEDFETFQMLEELQLKFVNWVLEPNDWSVEV
ncbi:hypothetical protein PV11_00573 [Exophiala sideris]|uniref:Uncharacterized protein n=1 Tax=Exophiala sideris TaxID=1016849 RepID=A0A0D1ZDF3_9EURO|nr:hypothetical protein PV11_00573 [Exophiala sideris]